MIASSLAGNPRDSRRRASAATRSALPALNVLGSNENEGELLRITGEHRDACTRERDEQQRIGSLGCLVDDDAIEHRVAEHWMIAADTGREHDLRAIERQALGVVDLASGIAIELPGFLPEP